jgi:hypothetical protein
MGEEPIYDREKACPLSVYKSLNTLWVKISTFVLASIRQLHTVHSAYFLRAPVFTHLIWKNKEIWRRDRPVSFAAPSSDHSFMQNHVI